MGFLLGNSCSFLVYGNPVATAFRTSGLLVDSQYSSALRSEAIETNDAIAVFANLEVVGFLLAQMTNSFYLFRHYLTITRLFYVSLFPGSLFLFFGNCSGCHQGTKTRRIDMTFTSLSYNEERIARKTVGYY